MLSYDLKGLIGESYDLEEHIIDRLEFSYKQKVGNRGKSKICVIDDHEELITDNHSYISNIMLKVRYQEGDIIERYCPCDFSYMFSTIIRVGKSIREKFHWVPMHEKVYLFIDDAGGHGTNEAINEYDKNLMIDFNIKLVFQVLRTPYSNILDLGIWCELQATVQKTHYMCCCAVEALARSVYETWEKGELNEVIIKVFNRLKIVLVLIIEGDRGRI